MYYDLILIAILLFILIPTAIAGFSGAPTVPSPRMIVKKMVEAAKIKPGELVYDLGAGDGRILITAAKEHPDCRLVGFEYAPVTYAWARFKIFLYGLSKKIKLHWQNFYTQNLSHADVIFVYTSPHSMEKLRDKFEKELHSGTRVVSYAFDIKGWAPAEKVEIGHRKAPIYLYKIDRTIK